ncbi:hypothetical protein [Lysobacter gummosus]|jgi:hypothetical protein|uniref:hypothetical protein n=1 Tax=Lysobacter gummosus TaxID=262324 RepID=UPI003634D33F
MTTTEFIVILGGAALGYWLVAVVWPLWRDRGDAPPGPALFEADPPWHEVLDVAEDADRNTIDAAHQAKRAEHLPERVAHLSADVRNQAQRRIMQIDRAYAAAMRELGFGRRDGSGER